MTDPSDPTSPQSDSPAPASDAPSSAPAPDAEPTEAHVPPSPDAQPTEAYPPADAQPTEAYPQADAQPTQAYPPADAQPTQAYAPPVGAPPADAPYGQAPYGQPAYGQAPYGQPAYAAPTATADRPRTLAWASLGLAIGGLVLIGAAFIPLAWVSLILALVGGLLLLVALVLGIVTLASKKQGGKGLGIGAIAVSVFGGILWVLALTAALVWIGLSMAGSSSETGSGPDVSVSEEATPDDETAEEEAPTGVYDETAFLAAVRPEVLAIMQEIEPSITEELVSEFYTDDMLVASGEGLLMAGDAGRDAFISATVESSQGTFDEAQAARFYDLLYDNAELYLVE